MPNKIVTYIKDLKFSDQVRLAEIEDHINQKTIKKRELESCLHTVKCIAEIGYEPEKVLTEFKDIQYLDHKLQALEIAIDEMENDV